MERYDKERIWQIQYEEVAEGVLAEERAQSAQIIERLKQQLSPKMQWSQSLKRREIVKTQSLFC